MARLHRFEDREAQVRRAALLGVHAAHHLCAIGDGLHGTSGSSCAQSVVHASGSHCAPQHAPPHLLAVEGAILAGETLADDFGGFVHKDSWLVRLQDSTLVFLPPGVSTGTCTEH